MQTDYELKLYIRKVKVLHIGKRRIEFPIGKISVQDSEAEITELEEDIVFHHDALGIVNEHGVELIKASNKLLLEPSVEVPRVKADSGAMLT